MKRTFIFTIVTLLYAVPALAAEPISVAQKMDGADGDHIPDAVKKECKEFGLVTPRDLAKGSKEIKLVPKVEDETKGRVLKLEITNVRVAGGGRYSGAKKMTVEGKLLEEGKVVGSFTALRGSWKGRKACGMLVNDEEAIASDILAWLKNPTMDAKIGKAKEEEEGEEEGEEEKKE